MAHGWGAWLKPPATMAIAVGARCGRHLAAASTISIALLGAASAATTVLPGAVQPGHDRETSPIQPPLDFDLEIQAPQRSATPRAVEAFRFHLNNIRIVGAESIPAGKFQPLFSRLIGRDVSLSDIYDVAKGIEDDYHAAGYPLVRAFVPVQHVKDGIFTIKVVEGYVDNVTVEGGDDRTRRIVEAVLKPVANERPLRQGTIERALYLANSIPGVAATGILRASPKTPGASELDVKINEPGFSGGLAADNRGSHFTGIWTVSANATVSDILGADALDAAISVSPNAFEEYSGRLNYRAELGDDGLIGSVFLSGQKGAPGGSLGPNHIRTDSWAVGPRLTYPVLLSWRESLWLDGGLSFQDANVDVLGSKVSHDVWRVADLALNYSYKDNWSGSLASTLDVAQGLPFLGASPNHSPDLSLLGRTNFTKITFGYSYLSEFEAPFGVLLRANAQYAFEPLIEGEQILFGGTQIGRGYDPGAITGDSGAAGSIELRYDTRVQTPIALALEPYTFFDGGMVWNRNRGPSAGINLENLSIESVGGGVRLGFPHNINLTIEGARTLRAVPGSDGDKPVSKLLVDISSVF